MKKQSQAPHIKATQDVLGNMPIANDLIQELVKDFFPKKNESGQTLFDANGNMHVSREERDSMIEELSAKFGEIFNILRIDRNDPNSMNTPHRLAKMWVNELFAGRFDPAPKITVFPNRKQVDELIISRNITVMSVCSHHWQPISGTCAIGYIPGDYVLGLSKLSRIVEWFSRRGQIQEELGEQIADFIEDIIKPKALGVVIESKHYCMIARGVNESEEKASMVTSVMRGILRDELPLRNEFLTLIRE
ncbi:MAG: GTP cyclohydrolase I [Candidatus Kapaibacteriota bacterium]